MSGLKNTGSFVRLAAQLFEGALSQPPGRFRSWMLETTAHTFNADGAMWRRSQLQASAHAMTVWSLPKTFARAWEGSAEINPLKLAMRRAPGRAASLAEQAAPDRVTDTRVYRRVLSQYPVRDAIGIHVVDAELALETEIVLTRSGPPAFSADLVDALDAIAPVMVGAAAQAYFLGLARPAADHAHRPSAVVDAAGAVLEAQDGFRQLMRAHYPRWTGQALPFDVPDTLHKAELSVGPLQVYAEHLAELTLLRVWEREQLEVLTEREREIADLLVQGACYKLVAQQLDLSPSTVANHVHRIYGKLEIGRKRELVQLMTGETPASD